MIARLIAGTVREVLTSSCSIALAERCGLLLVRFIDLLARGEEFFGISGSKWRIERGRTTET
jgi:hypothetical protein